MNGRTSRSEAMGKRGADDQARNLITDPRVKTVFVRRCRGEGCFDCACLARAFDRCSRI